jgi:hypothetical protein
MLIFHRGKNGSKIDKNSVIIDYFDGICGGCVPYIDAGAWNNIWTCLCMIMYSSGLICTEI